MILQNFAYSEFNKTDPKYWELEDFKLNTINLIVGNNASGKTRTLNVIKSLTNVLLNSRIPYKTGTYKTHFSNHKTIINYNLVLNDGIVQNEELIIDGEKLIERISDGSGTIKSMENHQIQKFKIPTNELVALRRDDIQYPYLNLLFDWASQLRHFRFATENEKQRYVALVDSNKSRPEDFNLKEADKSIEVFRRGKKNYSDEFINNIISDFRMIGYNVDNVDLGPLESIQVESPIPSKVVGLHVKESDRSGITDQNAMSDGMFRALSMLIHFNYYQLEKKKGTVLIDDIGEGLDFDRSTKLIKLLIEKSKKIGIQLIMSTNDKFVMNNTPLEFWQITHRDGGIVTMYNKQNSEKIFDEFRFTGLNNFDFFTTNFFKTGLN
ncbi:MAG: ATP-binding protein [Bacteroidota bacterium]